MSARQGIACIYWAHAFDVAWHGQPANQNEATGSAGPAEVKMDNVENMWLHAALRNIAITTMEADARRKQSYRSNKITALILVVMLLTWLSF